MKVYRNIQTIKRKDQLGRRLSLVGLAILIVGMIASFAPTRYPPGETMTTQWAAFWQQNWLIVSFAALPLGFLAASVGSFFITRYARRRWPDSKQIARPDEVLERSLKGLDDKHALYVYSLPVGFALLTSAGLLTMTVRSDRGRIIVNGDRWREPWGFGRIFTLFAREGVGNPPAELADQEAKMRELLSKAPTDLSKLPIEGAVVFLNAQMLLDLTSPSVAVLRADQIKEHIRKRARELKTPAAVVRGAAEWLEQNATFQAE